MMAVSHLNRMLAFLLFSAMAMTKSAYGEEFVSGTSVITADRLADVTWDAVGCGRSISWTWPSRAVSMTLTAVPDHGKAITAAIADTSVTEYELPVPTKAKDERRYEVTLKFLDAKGSAEVKSATVYSLTGLNGAATQVRIASPDARDWMCARQRFVIPAFAGDDTVSVDSTSLEGAFWRLAGKLENGQSAALLTALDESYSYSQTLDVCGPGFVVNLK